MLISARLARLCFSSAGDADDGTLMTFSLHWRLESNDKQPGGGKKPTQHVLLEGRPYRDTFSD